MNFCVECGEEAEQTIDGLCIECFLDGRKLISLPHHVDMKVCANCGDIGHGENAWATKDLMQAVNDAAADAVEVVKEAEVVSVGTVQIEQEPHTYVVMVDVVLDIKGVKAEDSASTIVRVKNTVCKRCSRQLGNYYESILQIRASKDTSQNILRDVRNKVEGFVDSHSVTNRQLFITKIEEVQGGIDFYLSSMALGKAAAKELADAYCAETKEAAKLIGIKEDGQEMFRVTYLVRLPDFHAGDVVMFEGRYFKLIRVSGSGAKVIDIMNFRERAVKRSDVPSLKVHARCEDLPEAVVVSRGGSEIQILNPFNYSTADLNIPPGAEIGDTVRVVEIDDALYYVP